MRYVNAAQAARMLGIGDKTIRRWLKEGKKLPSAIRKANGEYAIPEHEVEELKQYRLKFSISQTENVTSQTRYDQSDIMALSTKMVELEREQARLRQEISRIAQQKAPQQSIEPSVLDPTSHHSPSVDVTQKRSTTRKYESKAETEIPSDLPHGTIKLIDFIETYGLPESSMSRWTKREKGIKKGEWIETTTRAKASGMGTQHFLTPDQQERALETLHRHGKLKTPDSEEKPAAEERAWYLPDGE